MCSSMACRSFRNDSRITAAGLFSPSLLSRGCLMTYLIVQDSADHSLEQIGQYQNFCSNSGVFLLQSHSIHSIEWSALYQSITEVQVPKSSYQEKSTTIGSSHAYLSTRSPHSFVARSPCCVVKSSPDSPRACPITSTEMVIGCGCTKLLLNRSPTTEGL